ncbi:hypothetical protein [Heyndrickxia coagulans]|uniref:hypothetical protein n=1 Tax=Heyndrickxia coagulans TaxID=1398 RepID=UPI001F2BD912
MESMAGDGSFDIATYNPKQFVTTEAYRSLEGGLIQKAGVKPVQTIDGKDFDGHLSVKFHRYEDGVMVMEYRKPGSNQPYYELVNEIPQEAIPGSENPDDPLLVDIWNGFYDGAGKTVGEIYTGLVSLGKSILDQDTYAALGNDGNKRLSSPIATLKSTAHKSVDMAKYMGLAVQKAFERDVIHGDAKSRTEFFTYGLASIGISLLGDKGLSKLGTAAKVAKTGNLAEKAGKLKVNTGFAPALEAAGAGPVKIPYNVMEELGVRVQRSTEERWGSNADIDNAYDVARSGGKHSGFYKQYIDKSPEQIKKGIKSINKQVAEHQDKIKNPEKYIPNFRKLDPRQQDALINKKWPTDIQRQKEQKQILESILKKKVGR